MAKMMLELSKLFWENILASLTKSYEQGEIDEYTYKQKVDDVLDELLIIYKQLKQYE
jgi:hypothetical protein